MLKMQQKLYLGRYSSSTFKVVKKFHSLTPALFQRGRQKAKDDLNRSFLASKRQERLLKENKTTLADSMPEMKTKWGRQFREYKAYAEVVVDILR